MQTEFLSSQDERQHEHTFSRILNLQEKREINPPADPFKEEWKSLLPTNQFGDVSLASANGEFITLYKKALEDGNFEEFAHRIPEDDFSNIYRIKSHHPRTDKDKAVKENYTSESIESLESRLNNFLDKVENSGMVVKYKDEYRKRIVSETLQHLKMARSLGTSGYTVEQKLPEDWSTFVDLEKTQKTGTPVLPYEDTVKKLLKKSRDAKKGPTMSLRDAIDFWELSDKEKEEIDYHSIKDDVNTLSNKQTVILLKIMHDRLGLFNWKCIADSGVIAINDSAREREMQVPIDREFDGGDIRDIPGHESVHSASVENGDKQEYGLLWEGVHDYLKIEEGKAAANELILGLSRTDPRQVKLYGRYLAVSMALKADMVDGKPAPRYSTQQIYDSLKEYGIREIDAKDIVWRIMRGTSLKHQGVMLPVRANEGDIQIPSAECFVKDSLYFEGQHEVFNWLKMNMPVKAGHRKAVTIDAQDFSDKTLARVGLKVQELMEGKVLELPLHEAKEQYPTWVRKGRYSLLQINNLLAVGKIRLDMLQNNSFWEQNLRFGSANGQTDIQDILKPRE